MSTKPNQFELMQKIHEAVSEVAEVTGMIYYDYAVQGAFGAYTIYTECMLYCEEESDSDMDMLILSLKYDVMSQTIEVYDITEERPEYDFNEGITNMSARFVGSFVSFETFKEFVMKAYRDVFNPTN